MTNLWLQNYAGRGLYAAIGIELYSALYTSLRANHQQAEGEFTVLHFLTIRGRYYFVLPNESNEESSSRLHVVYKVA